MSEEIVLYHFRYRDEKTGKILKTSFRLSEAEAEEQFGDRLIERVEDTREMRRVWEQRGDEPKR